MIDLSMFDSVDDPRFTCMGAIDKKTDEYNPKNAVSLAKNKLGKWEINKPGLVTKEPNQYWLTRSEVLEASKQLKKSIGVIMGNNVACIDLDNCLDDEGKPNDFASGIISMFNDTYIEKSSSGKGLHIFLKYTGENFVNKSRKPDDKKEYKEQGENIDIEMYNRGKFILFTGNSYGQLKKLKDYSKEFNSTYDKYFGKEKKPIGRPRKESEPRIFTRGNLDYIFNSIVEKLRSTSEGKRNETLRDCARALGNYCNYLPEQEARSMLLNAWNEIHPDESTYEFEDTFKRSWNYGAEKPKELKVANDDEVKYMPEYFNNDTDQAKVFNKHYGNIVKHCDGLGFLVFDGIKWEQDNKKITVLMEHLVDEQTREAYSLSHKEYMKHVNRYKNDKSQKSVINLLKAYNSIKPDELDADPYILNTPDGVINLKDSNVRPNKKEDYCTKITGCSLSDNGKKTFHEFLDYLTREDKDLQKYIQEMFGQALIGKVSKKVFFLYSTVEGSGKSTLIKLLGLVFGSYSELVNIELLTKNLRGPEKSAAIMKLKGVRFARACEIEEGAKLDTVFIKQSTSNDGLTAKYMGCNFVDFYPTHTLILSTNHMPESTLIDGAVRDRISAFGFHRKIRYTEKDIKDYENILFAKCGGYILKWAVEGARKWIANGEKFSSIPECVKKATQGYFDENDVILNFIDMYYDVGDDQCFRALQSKVYELYSDEYCRKYPQRRIKKQGFKERILEKFGEIKAGGYWFYTGLRLKKGVETNDSSFWHKNVIEKWVDDMKPTIYGERVEDMYNDFCFFFSSHKYHNCPGIDFFCECIEERYKVDVKTINTGATETAEIFVESENIKNDPVFN